jgi:hypothetical protein
MKGMIMEDDDDMITGTTDDGEEYTIDLDVCMKVADRVIESLFELDESGELENFDAVATCFSLFLNTYHVLIESGWTLENLKEELDDHFQMHKNSMN